MSSIEVRQVGHVAVAPVVQTLPVKGRNQTKTVLTVISNNRWVDAAGASQERATSISWTVWGKLAREVSESLRVGGKVGVSGTLESRHYTNKEGRAVYTFEFTARSVEHLETQADADARRTRRDTGSHQPASPSHKASSKSSRSGAPGKEA
jgi:single stranded DNA-binding protein